MHPWPRDRILLPAAFRPPWQSCRCASLSALFSFASRFLSEHHNLADPGVFFMVGTQGGGPLLEHCWRWGYWPFLAFLGGGKRKKDKYSQTDPPPPNASPIPPLPLGPPSPPYHLSLKTTLEQICLGHSVFQFLAFLQSATDTIQLRQPPTPLSTDPVRSILFNGHLQWKHFFVSC